MSEPCVFAASARRMHIVINKSASLRRKPQLVRVVKLSGPVERNFLAGWLVMFRERSAKVPRK